MRRATEGRLALWRGRRHVRARKHVYAHQEQQHCGDDEAEGRGLSAAEFPNKRFPARCPTPAPTLGELFLPSRCRVARRPPSLPLSILLFRTGA